MYRNTTLGAVLNYKPTYKICFPRKREKCHKILQIDPFNLTQFLGKVVISNARSYTETCQREMSTYKLTRTAAAEYDVLST